MEGSGEEKLHVGVELTYIILENSTLAIISLKKK